jgi:hypothetical protein
MPALASNSVTLAEVDVESVEQTFTEATAAFLAWKTSTEATCVADESEPLVCN